ncbi:2,3-dihydro-2,3-dihydroxybenzoate dehydrogenase [Lipingzhangella sp. LS1_29]|uniref:2,3-dihydro-2,3-dihydroxybenzoate dehydrogenase n=1 Tax=Lipingzhangella rawalii TaxID=2055835 RepID=A0ABU2H655_9ACTN|nr:2,3-dihydro-2,3-dihydroxybenzoate dehydrogenase [Lipingzhangella rawalii]MDS1270781.1 2,3-dihydro-2,3-dihydroxybenzoate dehydrogenase [Lipingzhangella rawalii]
MEDKTALVTGAASGIGAAVARALGERGASVAAVDRDAAALQRTTAKLAVEGIRVVPIEADVRSANEAQTAVASAEDQLGPLDYLVNAAGVLRLAPAVQLTDEQWEESMAVNAAGVFTMSRAVAQRMVPRAQGSIVTVASNAAGTARADMAAYSASKAAAVMFTKCMGLELAAHGIRCNIVAPGSTDTPMLRSMWDEATGAQATLDGDPDAYRVGIPLRRLGSPEDVADAALFLLSSEAAHITMHTLTVDGGATLGV